MADTEEAGVEFGGSRYGGECDVADVDRRVLGAVPAVLAPFLEEVGVGLRTAQNGPDRVGGVGNTEPVGGFFDRDRGGSFVELADLDEAEEALGVAFGAPGKGRKLGKTGSDRFSGASRKRVVKPLASASFAIRFRRTVLPVPLRPTIIRLFAASRLLIRSRAMAASSRSSSRPASSGGGVPAPGA